MCKLTHGVGDELGRRVGQRGGLVVGVVRGLAAEATGARGGVVPEAGALRVGQAGRGALHVGAEVEVVISSALVVQGRVWVGHSFRVGYG